MKALSRSNEIDLATLIKNFSKIIPSLTKKDHKAAENLKTFLTSINSYYQEMAITPLHAAARTGDLKHLSLLINEFNIDPNSQDANGWTALHLAAQFGHLDFAKELIEKYKLDVNLKSKDGKTPFMFAKEKRYPKLAAYLQKQTSVENKENEEKIDEEKLIVGRRLYQVLGGEKLSKKVPTEGTDIHAPQGATQIEGYETLSHYLKAFAKTMPDNNFTSILKHLNSVDHNFRYQH